LKRPNLREIKAAVTLARNAHKGQFRKGPHRDPFFNHPRRVCKAYLAFTHRTSFGMIAALCHDVVEDTELTLDDIDLSFGREVKTLVAGLTKHDGMPTRDYLLQLGDGSLEIKKLKLCDIEDNILTSTAIEAKTRSHMLTKWKRYLEALGRGGETFDSPSIEYQRKWDRVMELLEIEQVKLAGINLAYAP